MKQSQSRALVLTLASSFTLLTAFACGNLDARDVTRGPDDEANGGDPNGPDGTGNKSSGGSDNLGGETNLNPFGGESAGGAPPVVDGPPEVVDVLPQDAADDADPTDVIGLKFSEALDDTTVTSDSIKLLDGAKEIAGKLSYAGVAATLKPSQRLSLLATYDVQVTQDITDTSGQKLKAPFASKFTVRDGAWGTQKAVFDDQTTWAGAQDIGIDAAGNAFVVWASRDPATYESTGCMSRRFNVRAGWEDPVLLSDAADGCDYLQVAVSPEGDAIAAWMGGVYPNNVARARRFTGGGWEATPLDVDLGVRPADSSDSSLTVAVRGGQAVVAWVRYEGLGPPAYDAYYYLMLAAAPIDGAWPMNPAQNFTTYYAAPDYNNLGYATAAVDDGGNAIVLLNRYSSSADPESKGVYYARKAVGGNWQSPAKIPGTVPSDSQPSIVSDGDGAMAVWTSYDTATTAYRVLASRYTKAKQFAAPVPIQDPDLKEPIFVAATHALVSDGKSFFTCWRQAIGSSANAYATRYDIASGKWDALPTVVSDGVSVVGTTTSIGVDAHGNAIIAFDQQAMNATLIMWSRYTSSDGKWSKADPVTADDMWYRTPMISVGGNGVTAMLFGAGHFVGHGGAQGLLGGQYRIFQ
jgi:hypothetical protein